MEKLICPVCRQALHREEKCCRCDRSHVFDLAKEGYVNLLCRSKNGDRIGDDKMSARSRRDFLNKGYYASLQDGLTVLFADKQGSVLDICCGEGYYTSALGMNPRLSVYGFDISKEMVRLAAKRGNGFYFVANMAAIPAADESFDYAIHLFAPFLESEFARVLKPGGRLFSVVPGENHLFGLKALVYENPYRNDEQLPETKILRLVGTRRITNRICLDSPEDIEAVFRMTPYYFHTSKKDRDKLLGIEKLDTDVSFLIAEYERP